MNIRDSLHFHHAVSELIKAVKSCSNYTVDDKRAIEEQFPGAGTDYKVFEMYVTCGDTAAVFGASEIYDALKEYGLDVFCVTERAIGLRDKKITAAINWHRDYVKSFLPVAK